MYICILSRHILTCITAAQTPVRRSLCGNMRFLRRHCDKKKVRQVRFSPEAEAVGLKGSTIMCLGNSTDQGPEGEAISFRYHNGSPKSWMVYSRKLGSQRQNKWRHYQKWGD